MLKGMSFSPPGSGTVLGVFLACLWLVGCVSQGDPRNGYRDPYAHDPYDDVYYDRHPDYIVIDRGAERVERHQERETKQLDQEQNEQRRALERAQEDERRALKDAVEWDKQDRLEQKQERKQQKRVFKQEDRELRDHQREEWENY